MTWKKCKYQDKKYFQQKNLTSRPIEESCKCGHELYNPYVTGISKGSDYYNPSTLQGQLSLGISRQIQIIYGLYILSSFVTILIQQLNIQIPLYKLFHFLSTWYESGFVYALWYQLLDSTQPRQPNNDLEKCRNQTHTRGSPPTTTSVLSKLTMKMVEVLNKAPTPTTTVDTTPIDIKLDGSNYALWSQVVEMFISRRDKLGYINGNLPQPTPINPSFRRWRIENVVVKGQFINTMDSSLVNSFIWYPTAKEVQDAIVVTFFNGNDTAQVYELWRWVSRLRQNGGSLEKFYNEL